MSPVQIPRRPQEIIVSQARELRVDFFEVLVYGTSSDQLPVSVQINLPFSTPEEENDLSWYCEVADREPFSVSPRLNRVEKCLQDYGIRLFKTLFSKPAATLPTKRPIILRVLGDSRFCSLHWELLRDPVRGPVILDLMRCVVRDVPPTGSRPCIPHPIRSYPTLNVLFLTARQRDDKIDIPLRVESLTVMDVVREHSLPLRVDLVRPGTLTALTEKLNQRNPGFYHVLHLDCHGADGDFEYVPQYYPACNRLLLETERAGYKPVSADEIAQIVDTYEIPIVFTSACRSGKTRPGVPSFAYDLFSRSRVQCVLVMALSVLVDTTARFVREFYLALLDSSEDNTVGAATRRARRAMWSVPKRKGVLGSIERQDWWIPQLFERSAPSEGCTGLFQRCTWEMAASLAPLAHDKTMIFEDSEHFAKRRYLLTYEAVDSNKFMGKDEDLRRLECKVFSHERKDNVILLHGTMGCGKTAFMTYVSWWWCVTGLVRDKFVFRLHERPFTLNDMIWHIYRQLFNVTNYDPTNLSKGQLEENHHRVTEHLKNNCCIIVFDSAERLYSRECNAKDSEETYGPLPPHDESEGDSDFEYAKARRRTSSLRKRREQIGKWLAELLGHRTIVLVGSRGSSESPLMEYIENKSNKLDLAAIIDKYPTHLIKNLSSKWSTALVKHILNVDEGSIDPRYEVLYSPQMLDLYGGNPLVINLVVGSVKAGDIAHVSHPEDMYERLHKCLSNASSAMSVMQSLEYSFNLLSVPQQEALLFLAPFKCSVTSEGLDHYADALERNCPKSPKFDRAAWDSAILMAVRWGLLTPHERVKCQTMKRAWRIHACLSILLMRKLCHKVSASSKGTLKELSSSRGYGVVENCDKEAVLRPMLQCMHMAYWKWALQIYDLLRASDKSTHDSGHIKSEIEFWNMKRILKYALDVKEPFYGILLPMYWYLASKNDITRRYALCRKIVERIGTFTCLSDIPVSNSVYRMDVPRTYHIYGMLLGHNRLHKLDEAEHWFSHTKTIWEACGNKNELAVTEHELGWVAMNKRDYAKAKMHYAKALELSGRVEQSRTLHNMGLLAAFENDFELAKKYHEEARRLYEGQRDARAVASAYHHMAIVSSRVHMYEEAERYAKKASTTRKERQETEQAGNVYQLRGNIAQRRARATTDRKEALRFLNVAKRKYDKAMLAYNCDSSFQCGIIPEREMLHENYGLLVATQRKFAKDAEEKKELLRTEMESYLRVKDSLYPKALYNLGLNYEELGHYEKAYQCFCQASAIPPNAIKDTLHRNACMLALSAKARCLANGIGIAVDEHEAIMIMLRIRGEIGDEDPLASLGLPLESVEIRK